MKAKRAAVPARIASRLRSICGRLPEAHEEAAWVGIRWRIGKNTFAHVLTIADGWPPAYAKAAGTDGPCCVVTFRSRLSEVDADAFRRYPFFKPVWWPDIAGMFLAGDTDWKDVGKLLEMSYRLMAPRRPRR
jgi:hypothetical protein